MSSDDGVVKTRAYDAGRRRARAQENRETTLARAQELFLSNGYAATTVEAIAAAAGVSAATVYKTYGGKAGLVRELCRRALAGQSPVPAEQRSDALSASDLPQGWGRLAAEVSPRISPLVLLLTRAADTDADAAALLLEIEQARMARMTVNASRLRLREGVTRGDARDVLWLVTSPEFYDLMVVRRGWSAERFGRLVSDTISGALL